MTARKKNSDVNESKEGYQIKEMMCKMDWSVQHKKEKSKREKNETKRKHEKM